VRRRSVDKIWALALGSETPAEIPNPNWQQILEALHSLDGGVSLDLVSLTEVGIGTLTAGGGDNRRYLVVYFPANHPDSPSFTLTDPTLIGPPVNLTIQTTDEHEAKYAVGLSLVIQVFEYFFHTGEVSKNVHWEIDNTGKEVKWE
jgi:hypothetical protein